MTLRKHLLNNMVKMLNWISEEFKKADCEVPYQYEFERGFIYGWKDSDYLNFVCHKKAHFSICHYNHDRCIKDGKLFNDGEEYTQSYFTNPDWYIPREDVKAFKLAIEAWPRVKVAVLKHLESINNVANFEV